MADRFAFGCNWQGYIAYLPLSASAEAESLLTEMLGLIVVFMRDCGYSLDKVIDVGFWQGYNEFVCVRDNA